MCRSKRELDVLLDVLLGETLIFSSRRLEFAICLSTTLVHMIVLDPTFLRSVYIHLKTENSRTDIGRQQSKGTHSEHTTPAAKHTRDLQAFTIERIGTERSSTFLQMKSRLDRDMSKSFTTEAGRP